LIEIKTIILVTIKHFNQINYVFIYIVSFLSFKLSLYFILRTAYPWFLYNCRRSSGHSTIF